MDNNLTGLIAANVTLIQPWYTGDLGLVAGAILGAIITGGITLYRDSQNEKNLKRDNRIRAITRLRGLKHTMLQSKASYYSAFFGSETLSKSAKIVVTRYVDYDNILHLRRSGSPIEIEEAQQYVNKTIDSALRKSLELNESLREKKRSEELQRETARNDERFWETIGQIKILFPNDKVAELIHIIKDADEELGKFEKEVIESAGPIREKIKTNPGRIVTNAEREEWVTGILADLDKWAKEKDTMLRTRVNNFDSVIEDLLNYLENEFFYSRCCRECKLFCSSWTCPLKRTSSEEAKKKV
jgi:hypothetical protein